MTSYINDETIEKVRESSDIVNIISEYVQLKKTGGNYVGLCPFHNEKTPSFSVSDTKQFFHCFGCGEGGDALSFIMKVENLEFPEAVKFLANKLGIGIEEISSKNQKLVDEKNKAYEINKETARFFFSNLTKNEVGLNYLYNRKINNKIIKQFGLGSSAKPASSRNTSLPTPARVPDRCSPGRGRRFTIRRGFTAFRVLTLWTF